ncbi:MAG: hypothetical protein ACE14P_04990 [Methanotrichaceae archaeon]
MTQQVSLEELLRQLKRIPAEWLDEDGRKVLESIPQVIGRIDNLVLDQNLIGTMLIENQYALDVFRLFLDVYQDVLANEMRVRGVKGDFTSIRSKCKNEVEQIAQILIELGLIDAVESHRSHEWTLQDILWDRYGHMRGRAMTAQKRGATLEDAVESILIELRDEMNLTFDRGGNFVNRSGERAKADFSVPSRENPKSPIEGESQNHH